MKQTTKLDEPGGISLPIAPRESLATRSAIILKRYLLTEHLKPGDRLPPERRLAEALNVSRTVLRSRSNSRTRSWPSSARSCFDSAGWLT